MQNKKVSERHFDFHTLTSIPNSIKKNQRNNVMTWPPPDPMEDCDVKPNIRCVLHDDYNVIAACETCAYRLVCSQCMITTCYGHKLCNLEEVAEGKKEHLSSLIREAETNSIPKLEIKINQVKRKREIFAKHCDDVTQNIRQQAEEMKRNIDEICENLILECVEFQKRKDDILKVFEESIEKDYSELLGSVSKVKDIISGGHLQDLLANDDVTYALGKPQSTTCIPVVAAVWFSKQENSIKGLNALFGGLTRSASVCEFEHIPDEIRTIGLLGEQAWISCDRQKFLYHTNKEGDMVQSIKVCSYFLNHIVDICPGADDDVWVACRDGNLTQIVSHDVQIKRFFTGVHSTVYSVYVFDDGDIVLGVVEGVLRLKGKLVRYNVRGQVLDRAVHDTDGKLMFSVPDKVRGCEESREIAVVNHDNRGDNSIVILDAEMKFKLNFKGRAPFMPSDVCFDSGQNILISDRASKSVILLDSHGLVCRTLLVASVAPTAICIQDNGDLWTGFENGLVRIYKYAP